MHVEIILRVVSFKIQVSGDCVRWIVSEIHEDTCLCIVQLGVEQQYGESPDTNNCSTVKARTRRTAVR